MAFGSFVVFFLLVKVLQLRVSKIQGFFKVGNVTVCQLIDAIKKETLVAGVGLQHDHENPDSSLI